MKYGVKLIFEVEADNPEGAYDLAVDTGLNYLTAHAVYPIYPVDARPHSRACGITKHDHGTDCHTNCPTCGGKNDIRQ